jgi:4-amino-4-deoxychorismate lyase
VPVIELDGRPVPLDREVTAALERGLGRPQD